MELEEENNQAAWEILVGDRIGHSPVSSKPQGIQDLVYLGLQRKVEE